MTCPAQDKATCLIAIVDDEPMVRSATSSLLRSLGFECLLYPSAEALLAGELDAFDGVLSDIQMPGMSGLALAERLHERSAGLPVLLMTAYPDERAAALRRAGRVADLLAKPLDGDLVEAALHTALAHRAGD